MPADSLRLASRAQRMPQTSRVPAEPDACAETTGGELRAVTRLGRPTGDRSATDADLVARVRQGDDAAFQTIVERYRPLLLRHARRIAGEDAQDAVQQALISAWSALRGGCEIRGLRPWLFTIAHRAALQTVSERGEQSAQLPDSLAGGRSPVEQFEQSAATRLVLTAIAKLPASERHALVSTGLLGRSGRDTAAALGMSEGAVRQLVFRARSRVRATAHVFLPPVWVMRRLCTWRGVPRRFSALGNGGSSAGLSVEAVGVLVKVGAVVIAGVALSAPVIALNRGEHRMSGRVPSSAKSAAQGTPGDLAPSLAAPPQISHSPTIAHTGPTTAARTGARPGSLQPRASKGELTTFPAGVQGRTDETASPTHTGGGTTRKSSDSAGAAAPAVGLVVQSIEGTKAHARGALPGPPPVGPPLKETSQTTRELPAAISNSDQVATQVLEEAPSPSKVVDGASPIVNLP